MGTMCLPLSMSAWRLFSGEPVSRAMLPVWDHLEQGGGISSKGQHAIAWSSHSSGSPAAVEGTGQDQGSAGVWLEGQHRSSGGVCAHRPT